MPSVDFTKRVKNLLQEYESTSLGNRWEEATSFGAAGHADAFWIRNSKDLVNIVWLNEDGIRDITLLTGSSETMFNFLLLKNIVAFEIREKEHITEMLSLGVEGHLVVHLVVPSPRGQLYWVANTERDVRELHVFLKTVMQEYLRHR